VGGALTGMPWTLLQPDKAAGNAKIISTASDEKWLASAIMIFQCK
jgi:hypothetical protein